LPETVADMHGSPSGPAGKAGKGPADLTGRGVYPCANRPGMTRKIADGGGVNDPEDARMTLRFPLRRSGRREAASIGEPGGHMGRKLSRTARAP